MTKTFVPHPVDVHVGARIRLRRKEMGISQTDLADVLGLTFQQVQKYERGSNRVSASKLYDITNKLETPIEYFFVGLNTPLSGDTEGDKELVELIHSAHGHALIKLFLQLPASARGGVVSMVRGLVSAATDKEPAA
jgi:transcriptional regulator with XRE-family HTH domain